MAAIRGVPQPFPYQGSKRQLAREIVACLPPTTKRLIEPFAGSAAVTLASAYLRRANRFWLNDAHEPLMKPPPQNLWVDFEERGRFCSGNHGRFEFRSGVWIWRRKSTVVFSTRQMGFPRAPSVEPERSF